MASSSLQALVARATASLERGLGPAAAQMLAPALRSSLPREEELTLRAALAEAWLLQDDLDQAATALGRPPDAIRDPLSPGQLSTLWRLHGRLAAARGDQSRAIALLVRALKQAEAAHDSHSIGLAHYELGHCYRRVGDLAIVREHITKAASALHAAGDRRHLALVHSLSAITSAQNGRYDEAMSTLRHAEHLASLVQAVDVQAMVCGNQASVMVLEHRYEQALEMAERSVALHQAHGSGHGLAVALGVLGQICVRLGNLTQAETALHQALDVRSPIQFHETTGAVFDTLAQIHLVRGNYELADEYLSRAVDAYGAYGRQTSEWYDWSLRVLGARLLLRRGALDEALARADEILAAGAPQFDALQVKLIAAEALIQGGRLGESQQRLTSVADELDAGAAPAAWGEYLRLRGELQVRSGLFAGAYHDFAQSTTVLDLLGERYQAALSHLALGRLAARTGPRSIADLHLDAAQAVFAQLGAERDLSDIAAARLLVSDAAAADYILTPANADEAIVRRLVDAAALPELLSRETAAALLDAAGAEAVIVFAQPTGLDMRVLAAAGCDLGAAPGLVRAAQQSLGIGFAGIVEPIGRDSAGPRFALVIPKGAIDDPMRRRLRMLTTVAAQGYALCAARDRSAVASQPQADRSLEPLLPGFLSASAAMGRVVDQIQRLQGNELTVLITGESGTGKELVARAIHVGSHRSAAMFLPYNCTTTGRDLADSQLFGHRRGAFTGAVTDQPGLIRSAAGGTLFLDEIGDLALDVQPKLLRFLEQSEIMPVGETRPQKVDVRVLAATNAELEQRVSEGKFREDLYYRLSVIRIHVPPLRERREEIPHLATFFVREACERLGKHGTHLSSGTLEVFSQYWWPGNVRQLKNEVQRAVALSAPGSAIEPEQLSPEITTTLATNVATEQQTIARSGTVPSGTLVAAVEQLERDLIQNAMERTGGNISETARSLGLTRRGLYLKLRRLGLDARIESGADLTQ